MQRESDFPPGGTTLRDPPVSLDPGTVIDGRYRLVELIGEGGMGQVFEAEHLDLRRKVAIKTLVAQGGVDPQLVQRFEREAHTLAAVAHPNIVTVTDYGVHEDLPYLVMERLEGRSLAALLETRGTLSVEHATALMRQVLAGLGHAHARGLVHRDLKPGNVWVETHDDGEHVKLLDFGFAKFVEAEGGPLLTAVGIVVGTIAYMSPEQASGGAIDHRSDLYSAGVLFYEMVTGRRPFEGEPVEILRAHLTADPPPLREARPDGDFSPELEAVVKRALEKKPALRFESAGELAKALQAATARESSPDASASADDDDAKTIVREPAGPAAETANERPAVASKTAVELRTRDLEPIATQAAARKKPPAPPPGRSRRPVLIAAVATVVLGGALVAVLLLAPWPFGAREAAEPAAAELASAVNPPERPAESLGEDPWGLWPRVPRLERYRTAVRRGGSLSRDALKDLRTYGREHPEDPRVELIIAGAFLNDRWFRDALAHYAGAHAKDARIAASEEFLSGLVQLVRYEVTSERASALVEEIYGARAVGAVEGALADASSDRAAKARLEALLRRLQS